jgi:uncharacterized protein YjbJ (UPF0337 family)
MNWDQIQGKWTQVKGSAKQQWGKLTDNDLDVIAGSKDKLVGKIQERYGIKKEEALRQFDNWSRTLVSSEETRKPSTR